MRNELFQEAILKSRKNKPPKQVIDLTENPEKM
jgi:hypothetical protein